jgi:WXG100 family type VII secretion target
VPDLTAKLYQLRNASRDLRLLADDGRAEVARLADHVAEVVGASWRGSAASGFGTGFDAWRLAALDGIDALAGMAAALDAAADDYAGMDTASADDLTAVEER